MNRIHRTIFDKARNAMVAVSELTRGQGKAVQNGSFCDLDGSVSSAATAMSWTLLRTNALCQHLAIAGLMLSIPLAHALPQGGQVTAGSATIVQSAGTTTVQQSSQNASLNWSSFNVGKTEGVVFHQPHASAIALNRIADTSASQILGSLSANGQVFLVNPNGILFGAGAQVNVGGLVASTLDISDSALTTASKTFGGTGSGSISNLGNIQTAQGGYVAFIGAQVSNSGTIQANGGTVGLGAGSEVTLKFANNQLLGLTVNTNTPSDLASNSGLIQADGGRFILSAGARDSVLAGVVSHCSRSQCAGVADRSGEFLTFATCRFAPATGSSLVFFSTVKATGTADIAAAGAAQ